jgi:thiamine biosynthesis lipoprotein
LELNNEAIATSGDYLQNWSIYTKKNDSNATIYFHVFDTRTQQPLTATHTSIASVSVLAPSCALADGLATASMIFSTIEEAQQWALHIQQQLPTVSFWIASRQTANERLISHD